MMAETMKDARADHRARHQHGRVEQAKAADEFFVVVGSGWWLGHQGAFREVRRDVSISTAERATENEGRLRFRRSGANKDPFPLRQRACYARRVRTRTGLLSLGKSLLLLLLLALLAISDAMAAARAATPVRRPFTGREKVAPRAMQFQALPLERSRQNHLLVRAFINGKPALMGVDTGAPVSAIARTRLAYFGLTPAPPNGEIPTRLQINGAYAGVTIARTLELGALNLIDEPLVAIDLSSSARAARLMNEQAIDGIIGADILFPTEAVLDCRAQVLILKMNPNVRGGAPGVDYSGFTRIPMQVSSGYNLYVDGTLNGRRARLMVDTGAFSTLLHQPFVRRMKIPMRESPFRSAGVNLKQRGVQFATISRFSVGDVHMRGKQVGVIDLQGLVRTGLLEASPPVAGLLGSEILRHHNGIIDFGTRTLYMKN